MFTYYCIAFHNQLKDSPLFLSLLPPLSLSLSFFLSRSVLFRCYFLIYVPGAGVITTGDISFKEKAPYSPTSLSLSVSLSSPNSLYRSFFALRGSRNAVPAHPPPCQAPSRPNNPYLPCPPGHTGLACLELARHDHPGPDHRPSLPGGRGDSTQLHDPARPGGPARRVASGPSPPPPSPSSQEFAGAIFQVKPY